MLQDACLLPVANGMLNRDFLTEMRRFGNLLNIVNGQERDAAHAGFARQPDDPEPSITSLGVRGVIRMTRSVPRRAAESVSG